jgi:hypothetical protein
MPSAGEKPVLIDPVSATLGRIEATCQATNAAVEKLEKAINGNGQPGLVQKVATVEEWQRGHTAEQKRSQWRWTFIVAVASIGCSVMVQIAIALLSGKH